MKKIIIVVSSILLFMSTAWADKNITLPYTENFSGSNSLSGISWVVNGATASRVQQSWRGGSDYTAKLTPPTSLSQGDNGTYGCLGRFVWTRTNTINIAFAVKIGPSYDATARRGTGNTQNKFIDVTYPGGRSGILCLNQATLSNYVWALWQEPTNTQFYYNGRTTNGIDDWGASSGQMMFDDGNGGSLDYAGKWLWVNYIVTTTSQKLYIYDRNGNYEGLYFEISTVNSGSDGFYVGGYYNGYHPTADANTYILIDDLQVTNSATPQSPPEGFLTSISAPSTRPGIPLGIQIVAE